jgi:hypothetical protein
MQSRRCNQSRQRWSNAAGATWNRIADVTEKVLPHLEQMQPAAILEGIHEIEKYDKIARRNFGLSDSSGLGDSLSINVLTNQAAVVVNARA